MNKLLNKKSILECVSEQDLNVHANEIALLDEALAGFKINFSLRIQYEGYEGNNLSTEIIPSCQATSVLNKVEQLCDYKNGIDISIDKTGKLIIIDVYGGTTTIDNQPFLKHAKVEVSASNNRNNYFKIGYLLEDAFEFLSQENNPEVMKKIAAKEVVTEENQNKKYPKKSKEERDKEVEQLMKVVEQKTQEYLKSGEYKSILELLSRFEYPYSLNNMILISTQLPNDSIVAPYTKWAKVNRYVKAGSVGAKILAPVKTAKFVSKDVLDDNGQQVLNDDGSVKKQLEYVEHISFRQATVFGYSQTDQIPNKPCIQMQFTNDLTDSVVNADDLINAIVQTAPCPVEFKNFPGEAKGYFSPDENIIVVKDELSDIQKIKTLFHEISHSYKDTPEAWKERHIDNLDANIRQELIEIEAESCAFVLCNKMNLNSESYSIPYISVWAKEHPELIQQALPTIKKVTDIVYSNLVEAYKITQDCKENMEQQAINNNQYEVRSVIFNDKETALYVETSDVGFDYTLYKKGKAVDGSFIETDELNIDEAVKEISKKIGIFEPITATYSFYIFGKSEENYLEIGLLDNQNISILANKIDQFMREFDPYEYSDSEIYAGSNMDEIFKNVRHNTMNGIKRCLESIVIDDRYMVSDAKELLQEIEKYSKNFEANAHEFEKKISKELKI